METTETIAVAARPRSAEAFERAQRVLVGGVNSPVRSFRSVGGSPVFIERAEGPYVYGADGDRYTDLVCSWGAAITGHAHRDVVDSVQRAAAAGLSFGACCRSESQLAERIVSALPAAEMVRFVSSGTEAVMSALRLARAATCRPLVLKFRGCYHGHADSMLVAAGSGAATHGSPDSAGVTEQAASQTLLVEYNDLAAVRAALASHPEQVAAVIVEPVAGNMGLIRPAAGFLEGLRTACDEHGALLVFDEVMTGFRVAWGGWQRVCGVSPDITTLGKVIGGGMPVAAYAGSCELMSRVSPLGPVYQAGTLSGNPVGMAAGISTLDLCGVGGFYGRLGFAAQRLASGLQAAADDAGIPAVTDAVGGMVGLFFSDAPVHDYAGAAGADHGLFGRFFCAMLERGVAIPPSGYEAWFVSSAHDDGVIDGVIGAAGDALRAIKASA